MKKANGPNVIQKPMSEHEPYRWKRVTKVAYQQERFKRNAKKVNKFFNSFFIFSLSVFFCMCVFVRMLWLCEVGWGKVVKFFSCFSSSSPSVWSKSNFQVQVKYFLFSSSRLTFFSLCPSWQAKYIIIRWRCSVKKYMRTNIKAM